MYAEIAIARRTVMLYAAACALFSTVAAGSANALGAPLMITVAWVLSTMLFVSIAMVTSIMVHRPTPVPIMAASRAMRQKA
jgi:hypothetical protein